RKIEEKRTGVINIGTPSLLINLIISLLISRDEFWPLSGKPFFDVVLTKTNIKCLYQLVVPGKFSATLPSCSIPTVLIFRGKNWEMIYHGSSSHKRLDNWRAFAVDNNLKVGDACVFEQLECSSTRLVFRVQILRGDISSEFLDKLGGDNVDAPIVLE
ncbi:PREDICTED: B3, partial [Prunus dulcis]